MLSDCSSDVVVHKTFHRYVVRAKCGTSQSQHDKKGGHAQSAGAQIRRHNENALAQVRLAVWLLLANYFNTFIICLYSNSNNNNKYV